MKNRLLFLLSLNLISSVLTASQLGLKNFRELPVAYSVVMDIPLSQPGVQLTIKKIQSRLPQKGDVEEMSSPMLLAAFELAGSYCSLFTEKEILKPNSQRVLFNAVDFSQGSAQFNSSSRSILLNRMSEAFWFRLPEEVEMAELDSFFTQLITSSSASSLETKNIAFLLCTYFGTSLQFLVD